MFFTDRSEWILPIRLYGIGTTFDLSNMNDFKVYFTLTVNLVLLFRYGNNLSLISLCCELSVYWVEYLNVNVYKLRSH